MVLKVFLMAIDLYFESGNIAGVVTVSGEIFYAPVVILTTGTFLRGKIHIGEISYSAGRAGEPAADALGCSIENIYEFELPDSHDKRAIIRIKKNRVTNKRFPRQYNEIKRQPL